MYLVTSSGERFTIEKRATKIGRSADNDIVLDNQGVSRLHALLLSDGSRFVLKDMNSTNGTFVNRTRIPSGGAAVVGVGHRIRFGSTCAVELQAAQGGNQETRLEPIAPGGLIVQAGAGRPSRQASLDDRNADAPRRGSGLATAALVCGILSLVVSLCAIPGLILGIRALRVLGRSTRPVARKRAVAALWLSGFSASFALIVGPLFIAPAILKVRRLALENGCAERVRRITQILAIIADDDGRLPKAEEWCDRVLRCGGDAETLFQCPEAPGMRCAYAFNASLSEARITSIPSGCPVIFEATGGWNAYGERGMLPSQPRHPNGYIVGFADTAVERLPQQDVAELQWTRRKETQRPEAEPPTGLPRVKR